MRYLIFRLSMPNIGSWNGKWTGEGRLYAVIKRFKAKDSDLVNKALQGRYYHHDFGDGWSAGITVSEAIGSEANKIKKKSLGFCGYEWMVDNILTYGRTRACVATDDHVIDDAGDDGFSKCQKKGCSLRIKINNVRFYD